MANLYFSEQTYSSSLLRAIIVRNPLPLFKIFSNFVHFFPNFQIFCPILIYFWPFLKNRTHALSRIGPGEVPKVTSWKLWFTRLLFQYLKWNSKDKNTIINSCRWWKACRIKKWCRFFLLKFLTVRYLMKRSSDWSSRFEVKLKIKEKKKRLCIIFYLCCSTGAEWIHCYSGYNCTKFRLIPFNWKVFRNF